MLGNFVHFVQQKSWSEMLGRKSTIVSRLFFDVYQLKLSPSFAGLQTPRLTLVGRRRWTRCPCKRRRTPCNRAAWWPRRPAQTCRDRPLHPPGMSSVCRPLQWKQNTVVGNRILRFNAENQICVRQNAENQVAKYQIVKRQNVENQVAIPTYWRFMNLPVSHFEGFYFYNIVLFDILMFFVLFCA
jgi:hypothetical protein